MRVAVPMVFVPLQRLQVAHFLGRPGDLATREELIAFTQQANDRRLAELPHPSPELDRRPTP